MTSVFVCVRVCMDQGRAKTDRGEKDLKRIYKKRLQNYRDGYGRFE